jgi:hypothetical protein
MAVESLFVLHYFVVPACCRTALFRQQNEFVEASGVLHGGMQWHHTTSSGSPSLCTSNACCGTSVGVLS